MASPDVVTLTQEQVDRCVAALKERGDRLLAGHLEHQADTDQVIVALSPESGILVREALRLEVLRYERQGSERQAKLLNAVRNLFPASEDEAAEGLTQELPLSTVNAMHNPLDRIADTLEIAAAAFTEFLEHQKGKRR